MTLISTGSSLCDHLRAERKRIHAEWRKQRVAILAPPEPLYRPLKQEIKSVEERLAEVDALKGQISAREIRELRKYIRASAKDCGEADPLDVPRPCPPDIIESPGLIIVPRIQHIVADYFGLSCDDLISSRRSSAIARARQIAMYMCKELTKRSGADIGRRFGGRDHTTVLASIRKIAELIATDAAVAHDVAALREMLG
jgi:chromosomal replication initiator protein